MDPTVKWFALGAGVFIVLLVWVLVKAAMSGRRRSAAIKEWAFRNGMQYVPGPVDVPKMPQDETAGNLVSRKAWNVVSGRREHYDVTIFDLHQVTGNRNRRTYSTRTVALLKLPEPLPPFRFLALANFGPSSFGTKLFAVAERMIAELAADSQGTMIQLPDHPGLFLLSKDPDATRALFTPSVIDYFSQHSGYGITTEGTSMMIDRSNRRSTASLDQIETLLNDATGIAQQFHPGF